MTHQLLGQGQQGLQNPTQGFAPYEQAARRGFETETIPLLAERFGGLNATGSSGYRNALSGAGTNFELGLNQQRQQYGQQNIGNLLQMLQLGLKPSTENIFTPPGQGFGSAAAGGIGTGIGLGGTLAAPSALASLGTGGGTASWLSGLLGGATNAAATGSTAATIAPSVLTTLAAQPWFWPVLAGLAAAGGGAYAYNKLSGD